MVSLLPAAAIVAALLARAQDMPAVRLPGGAQPPSTQAPRTPGQLPPLPVTQIDARDVTLDSPRRLTLTFAEPRPIDEVLTLLTAGTRFSIAIDADASGTFRGDLKQLALREALTTVLAPIGLDYQVQGTVIRVRRRQMDTRLFEIDLLSVQRGLARAAGTSEASVSTSVAAEDAGRSVTDGVKALLSDRGTVHVDARGGIVEVTDFSERLDRVALYVDTLQLRRGRQVRLQAHALEITPRDGSAIDWAQVREALGLRRDAPDAGIAADPSALRGALARQGDVRLLWAPDVTALNNEPALIRMATTDGTALTLTVVPQISSDGVVQMSVAHTWQQPDALDRRTAHVTETDTVMRIMDGSTALVAGLSGASKGAELVVLLRPSVVTPGTYAGGR